MEELRAIKELFEAYRNPENALPMQKYMKDNFPFLGIKKPERSVLLKGFFQDTGLLKKEFQPDLIVALWQEDEREYQYVALEYLEKSIKKLTEGEMDLLEKLMIWKPWWDTIDHIAPKAVGSVALRYPGVIEDTISSWANGEDLWLRRASILFQLKYKENTKEDILYSYILKQSESKEFFIQKAIGWALREYSKTNSSSVKEFISTHQLAKLSVREGSKYLND